MLLSLFQVMYLGGTLPTKLVEFLDGGLLRSILCPCPLLVA